MTARNFYQKMDQYMAIPADQVAESVVLNKIDSRASLKSEIVNLKADLLNRIKQLDLFMDLTY